MHLYQILREKDSWLSQYYNNHSKMLITIKYTAITNFHIQLMDFFLFYSFFPQEIGVLTGFHESSALILAPKGEPDSAGSSVPRGAGTVRS